MRAMRVGFVFAVVIAITSGACGKSEPKEDPDLLCRSACGRLGQLANEGPMTTNEAISQMNGQPSAGETLSTMCFERCKEGRVKTACLFTAKTLGAMRTCIDSPLDPTDDFADAGAAR
jgi:hypothetical protein